MDTPMQTPPPATSSADDQVAAGTDPMASATPAVTPADEVPTTPPPDAIDAVAPAPMVAPVDEPMAQTNEPVVGGPSAAPMADDATKMPGSVEEMPDANSAPSVAPAPAVEDPTGTPASNASQSDAGGPLVPPVPPVPPAGN